MNFPKIIVTLVIGYLSFVAYSSNAHAVDDLEEITIQIMEADDDAHEFINRIDLPPVAAPPGTRPGTPPSAPCGGSNAPRRRSRLFGL